MERKKNLTILTYEDWLACEDDEKKKVEFIQRAIDEHERSDEYKAAVAAQLYYDGENPTIGNYEKIIYDMKGLAHVDMWSANHKIASQFFNFAVNQEVAYLLGNGVRFAKEETKKKLGKIFDVRTLKAELYARIAGQSFGFWNKDHLDIFKFTEFVPIKGEETGEIMLGIRYWKLAENKPLRVTLFEIDGYTEYIRRPSKELEVLNEKQPYKLNGVRTEAEGYTIREGENYDGFPIVPLYANEAHKSAINGKRNTIDALDLVTSNMVNNCDEGNLIYWVLTNCGGMDDIDDAKFIEQLKTTHVMYRQKQPGPQKEPAWACRSAVSWRNAWAAD